MGVAEVSPLLLRDPTIRRLDYECRFALFALVAAAGPRGRFEWDAGALARQVLDGDAGAPILFTRLLVEAEGLGIIRRYDVGGADYGEVVLPSLLTAHSVGYRRTNRGARYPAPLEPRISSPVLETVRWELEFQLFWGSYRYHDNRDKAKAVWCALRQAGVEVEAVERAHTAYRLACYRAVAESHEHPRIGASAFLTEAWRQYAEDTE